MDRIRRSHNEVTGESSNSAIGDFVGNLIWKQNMPAKVKHFLWKACKNILLTKTNLARRKIPVELTCDFREWLVDISKLGGTDNMVQVVMVMWMMWNNRNWLLHEGKRMEPQQLIERANTLLQDFIKIQGEGRTVGVKISARWRPPTTGTYKVNVDGARFDDKKSVGLGVVVRDFEGQLIAAASKRMDGLFPPAQVEAVAMCFAMDFVRDQSLRSVIMEGDNLEVVRGINSYGMDLSPVGLIIEDIQCKAKTLFESVVFSHVGRIGNTVAHGLAHFAKEIDDLYIWMEEVPTCVRDHFLTDLSYIFYQ
ncbi:hypothetical protein L1049_003239 [Liquidambar formosana]|uniref:RNase H type-1 domain-containing protein n=1 Tax=Liquidambar formosana TaxID=63359 RepID=A0AAP0NIW9_LIQFO